MANDNHITIAGNLTADPELKYTAGGFALCKFTVAVNRRVKRGEEWDEQVSFFGCTVWREAAEQFSASVQKGDRVIVCGRLEQRSWEAEDGSKRSVVEIQVDEVGASLKSATAQIQRIKREQHQQQGAQGARQARPQQARPQQQRAVADTRPVQAGYDDFGEEPF